MFYLEHRHPSVKVWKHFLFLTIIFLWLYHWGYWGVVVVPLGSYYGNLMCGKWGSDCITCKRRGCVQCIIGHYPLLGEQRTEISGGLNISEIWGGTPKLSDNTFDITSSSDDVSTSSMLSNSVSGDDVAVKLACNGTDIVR